MTGKEKKLQGVMEILAATAIWGYGYIVIKDSLNEVPLSLIMLWRYVSALAGLALIFWRNIKGASVKTVWHGMALGILLYLSQFFQTMALVDTDASAGNVAFITALYVAFVPFAVSLRSRRSPDRFCIIGILLAVTGLFLLTGGWRGAGTGDWLALAGSLGFTIHIMATDRFAKEDDTVLLSMAQYAGAAVLGMVICLFTRPFASQVNWSPDMVLPLLYTGIVSTMMGFLLQTAGQKKLPPDLTSLLLSMEAVFGMVFSVAFSMESPTPARVTGGILMLAAILISQRSFSGGRET